jgi:restriction system protein
MINGSIPPTWKKLQTEVALILSECGLIVDEEIRTKLVRGNSNIDVLAIDKTQNPNLSYVIECKHWKKKVSKTVIDSLLTVVQGYGANWGFVISVAGFQSGCDDAAFRTNIKLLTWDEFQELFVDQWISNYLGPTIVKEAHALAEYVEPLQVNSHISRKADALSKKERQTFLCLQHKYEALAALSIPFATPLFMGGGNWIKNGRPQLPLSRYLNLTDTQGDILPSYLTEIQNLREFVNEYVKLVRAGIAEFDAVFGERVASVYPFGDES